jgi:hypothetical protein
MSVQDFLKKAVLIDEALVNSTKKANPKASEELVKKW